MQRIEIFEKYNTVTAFLSQKPDRASELIPMLARKLKAEEYLIKPHLVHGDRVLAVTWDLFKSLREKAEEYPELSDIPGYIEVNDTDGLITDVPGCALVSTHGDCIPVFVFDPIRRAAGIAHAGWKGTRLGIAERLVKALQSEYGCLPENIKVYIGPGIGSCCFKVTEEVVLQFRSTSEWMEEFIEKQDDIHWTLDLKGINRRYLELQGVRDIELSPDCTCCMEDKYWSYRRCGEMDRMLAYIRIN